MTGEVNPQRLYKYFFYITNIWISLIILTIYTKAYTVKLQTSCWFLNKCDNSIQPHLIMIYSSAISDQGLRPDVNNGPGSNWNSVHILPPSHHFLKSNSNNGLSPGRSNLESDGRYTCSSLPLIVSWWVLYLAKGPEDDSNNVL